MELYRHAQQNTLSYLVNINVDTHFLVSFNLLTLCVCQLLKKIYIDRQTSFAFPSRNAKEGNQSKSERKFIYIYIFLEFGGVVFFSFVHSICAILSFQLHINPEISTAHAIKYKTKLPAISGSQYQLNSIVVRTDPKNE